MTVKTVYAESNNLNPHIIVDDSICIVQTESANNFIFVNVHNISPEHVFICEQQTLALASLMENTETKCVSTNHFLNILFNQDDNYDSQESNIDMTINNTRVNGKLNINRQLIDQCQSQHDISSNKDNLSTKQNFDILSQKYRNLIMDDNFAENLSTQQQTIFDSQEHEDNDKMYSYKDIVLGESIPDDIRQKYLELFIEFDDVISKHKYDIGKTDLIKHHIQINDIPPRQKQRFLSSDKQTFANDACKILTTAGIIAPIKAPVTCTNLVLVPKHESAIRANTKADKMLQQQAKTKITSFRLACDMRLINSKTINQASMINITPEQLIDKVSKGLTSSFDVTSAYFNIPLTDESKELTSFYCGRLYYNFERMTQGLSGASNSWSNLWTFMTTDEVLNEIKTKYFDKNEQKAISDKFEDFLETYYDDSYVFSEMDHFKHFCMVKATLHEKKKAGLKISPKKCSIATTQFKVLGINVDTDKKQIFLDELKATAIIHWPKPSSLFELQSRLYSLIYWQKFIPGLKKVIYPLQDLLRSKKFDWTHLHDKSWTRVKTLIKLDLRLYQPDKNDQLLLFCDASKVSCSQILFAQNHEGEIRVVGANSKIFSYIDSLKSIYLKESISLVAGMKHFQSYMLANNKKVYIFTDAKSVTFIGRNKEFCIASSNIASYLKYFASMKDYVILHIKGQMNICADIFSRSFTNSRFIKKSQHSISKQHAKNVPPIPDNYSMESDDLFEFFTAELRSEQNDMHSRKKKVSCVAKPIEEMFKSYENITPEQRVANAIRLIEQFNDRSISQNDLHKSIISDKKNIQTLISKIHSIRLSQAEKDIHIPCEIDLKKDDDFQNILGRSMVSHYGQNDKQIIENISDINVSKSDDIYKKFIKMKLIDIEKDKNMVYVTNNHIITKKVIKSPESFSLRPGQCKLVQIGHIFSTSPVFISKYIDMIDIRIQKPYCPQKQTIGNFGQ